MNEVIVVRGLTKSWAHDGASYTFLEQSLGAACAITMSAGACWVCRRWLLTTGRERSSSGLG